MVSLLHAIILLTQQGQVFTPTVKTRAVDDHCPVTWWASDDEVIFPRGDLLCGHTGFPSEESHS